MTTLRPRGQALLIRPDVRIFVADKGIEWVTDSYVLARVDCFQRRPAKKPLEQRPLRVSVLRRLLAEARTSPRVGKAAHDTGQRFMIGGNETSLIGNGCVYAGVNSKALTAWFGTGLQPQLNARGQVLWYGTVRGRETLFGIVMPVRIDASRRAA